MKKIKFGIVGLGQRGTAMLQTFLAFEQVDVVAICDEYQDRLDKTAETIKEKRGIDVKKYLSFNEFINDKDLEAVYVATSWEAHINQSIKCMEHHIPVGMEVGGAYSVKDCWRLVKAYEKTKTPIMMLENCCYDKFELLLTSIARKGLLGDIIYCHGAYSHDLREEITSGNIIRHYRLRNYIARNCENYPTHELGPIAKLLNINHGNRMVSITSVASKAQGLHVYANSDRCKDKTLKDQEFKQGDIVSTIIKCENGETITMTLDTTLPGYYSRQLVAKGTKGCANQEANMIFLDKEREEFWTPIETLEKYLNNAKEYYDEHLPSYWKNITPEQVSLGHGGMDYLMIQKFVEALIENKPMPIDVYDAAAWYAITPLSALSIKHNGKPYKIPDFTKGKYKNSPQKDVIDF